MADAGVSLVRKVVLPVADSASDWTVMWTFYKHGDMGWFKATLAIQILTGLVTMQHD